jgi:hypothetical protein
MAIIQSIMDREDIYRRVVEVAERFGPGNPQELKQLSSQLRKLPPTEVLAGLLLVFTRSEANESNYPKQELAGRMLEKLNPKAPIDLFETIRSLLPGYNPSIEQVPQYLAGQFGKDAVIKELTFIESEEGDSRASASAKTMRWWLGDQTTN